MALNTLNHNYGQPLVVSALNVTGNTVLDGSLTLLGAFSLVGNSSLALSTPLAVTSGGTGLSATTKGGIHVGTGTSTFTNLTVGTDGYLLTVDSTQPSGVKWAAAPVSLPTQTGNAGSYLTTNGTTASWAAISSGTVTSVATGTGLTGGPITSTGTLSIDTAVVPQLGATNTFTNAITLAPSSTSVAPLVINSPSGTTVNPLNVQINGSNYLTVSSAGATTLAGALTANYNLALTSGNSLGVVATIKGAASQALDLVQYKDSSANVLGGVNAAGQRYIGAGASSVTSFNVFGHSAASAASTTVATYTSTVVSTVNPVPLGATVIITSFTPIYFNGTFQVTAIGGSSGAWTYTVYNAAATFTASGTSTVQGFTKISPQLAVVSNTSYTTPLIVRANTTQTVGLQEWQNSAGTALASIDSSGGLTTPSTSSNSVGYLTVNQYIQGGFASGQLANAAWVTNTANSGAVTITAGASSSLALKVKARTVTTGAFSAATANGTTSVVYTNAGYALYFVAGQTVSVTGITSTGNPSGTAGAGFNLTNATVASVVGTTITLTAASALTDTATVLTSSACVIQSNGDLTQWQNTSGTALAKVDYLGNLTATKFVTTSGTSSQFVKGDGSLDSTTYLNSANYNSYAPSLTGTSASGTWGISITGNAATATTATTATTASSVTNGLTTSNYSSYALPLGGGTMTGLLIGKTNTGGGIFSSLDSGGFSVRGDNSNAASMSFHRPGNYAIQLGLDTDNVFKIGGWSASQNIFNLSGSGNLTIGGTVTINSDRRIKSNITKIENALDKVNAISGYTFDHNGEREAGIIAQEVLEVLPEVVRTNPEGIYTVAYSNMVGLLIEAIKEQSAKIASLEEQVKELRG